MARLAFRLPDLGEGLTEAEILTWLVQPGDVVVVNQPLVEVETAKAAVEVPSPWAGRIATLACPPGETLPVGAVLVEVETADAPTAGDEPSQPERQEVLVGYGPRTAAAVPMRRGRRAAMPATGPARPAPARALAKPPVRRLARDLGVDIAGLTGTGPDGRICREDVVGAAQPVEPVQPVPSPRAAAPAVADERLPVRGVQRAMAAAMVASAAVPQVTEFLAVDVTATMQLCADLANDPALGDARLGPLAVTARALCLALERHPGGNASWDEERQEIVRYGAVNLGIAVASPRGLLVPSIKGAQAMPMAALARALGELTATAREGRCTTADLTGGTVSITNVGPLGVDAGTPLLNPGEAMILCLGAVRERPWVVAGELAVRQVAQLALTFDHRLVDGALGSAVLVEVGRLLEDPRRLLLAE